MAKSNGELMAKMEAQAPAERPRSVADEVANYLKRDSVKEQLSLIHICSHCSRVSCGGASTNE